MNYRKELKEFELAEAERVEMLRQKNADKQRRNLLKGQVSFTLCVLHLFCRGRKWTSLRVRLKLGATT
jgi:hypothetical protein